MMNRTLVITTVIVCSLAMCPSAKARDAWPSNLSWNYPETLKMDTSHIQYTWRFRLSSSYYSDCLYTHQLYLSKDQTLSNDDFPLFSAIDDYVPAGVYGYTATITRYFYSDIPLPETGTYYVFLELYPGLFAPNDPDLSNNATMAPSPIQVIGTPPGVLTTATVIFVPSLNQYIIAAGYDNGTLEYCNQQGEVLAKRNDLGEVTALCSGAVGNPQEPRLFVVSTDSGGILRAVDPNDINNDINSRSNLGTVTALNVCNNGTDAVYIGTSNAGGTLHKLNGQTLADEAVRDGMGEISDMTDITGASGDLLVVGSDKSGGSINLLDKKTLDVVTTPRQGLGSIYALASKDMDLDGEDELIIASESNGGSIRLTEGPDFAGDLAIRNQLGQVWALDYGYIGIDDANKPANPSILVACQAGGGSLRILNLDTSSMTLKDGAALNDMDMIYYAGVQDFYMIDIPLVGAVSVEDDRPVLQILDENLSEPDVVTEASVEDFETGAFDQFPWVRSGDSNWSVTTWPRHAGNHSAQSGDIDDDESSELEVTLNCIPGDITFYYKVSSEERYDYLRFYIDGVEQGKWSGEEDWTQATYPVTAGQRTFKWAYTKDSSSDEGDDTAWIDDIVFPAH